MDFCPSLDLGGEIERAFVQIDAGLAIARDGGQSYNEPFLHRLRGDFLLKRNPDDPAPAEDAYRTAVTLATKQGARTYQLLASLCSPNCINQRSAPSKLVPSSRQPSKVSRRRPKCRRSRKGRR